MDSVKWTLGKYVEAECECVKQQSIEKLLPCNTAILSWCSMWKSRGYLLQGKCIQE